MAKTLNNDDQRTLTFTEAIREAQCQCLEADDSVYIMGLGVPDPKGIFGTTTGLQQKFGSKRVFDIPLSENAITGVALGSSLKGMRPILIHQRIDFSLVALEQVLNQAAKWHFMFGGASTAPLVIRMIIGRGWGQGPQHSQSLQSLYSHFPGLKVVMPATAKDAKGLLISSVQDNNPVIFIEHRWLHSLSDFVPQEMFSLPLGKAKILRKGSDLTIIAASYMVIEAMRAAEILAEKNISAEIINIRTITPLDDTTIKKSVKKTGRALILDTGWKSFGISGEISARISENLFGHLKCAPQRISMPDNPVPTSWKLARDHYPTFVEVVETSCRMVGVSFTAKEIEKIAEPGRLDTPNADFNGPF